MSLINSTGDMMIVDIYTAQAGPPIAKLEGSLTLRHGAIVCLNDTDGFVAHIISKPLHIYHDDAPATYLDAAKAPKAFLIELVKQYRGDYLWATVRKDKK